MNLIPRRSGEKKKDTDSSMHSVPSPLSYPVGEIPELPMSPGLSCLQHLPRQVRTAWEHHGEGRAGLEEVHLPPLEIHFPHGGGELLLYEQLIILDKGLCVPSSSKDMMEAHGQLGAAIATHPHSLQERTSPLLSFGTKRDVISQKIYTAAYPPV